MDQVWPTFNNKNGVSVVYTVRRSLINWPFLEVILTVGTSCSDRCRCVAVGVRLKCLDCPPGPNKVVVVEWRFDCIACVIIITLLSW